MSMLFDSFRRTNVLKVRYRTKGLILIIALVAVAYPSQGKGQASKLKADSGQSLGQKLFKTATFIPKSTSTLERLMEVARHYQIPMGIEWLDEGRDEDDSASTTDRDVSAATLEEVVNMILQDAPGYNAEWADGLLKVSSQALADDPRNFLNLQVREFSVDRADVFGAEFLLRWKIRSTLHPEQYAGRGYGGGYGHAPDSPLARQNITLSGDNLTVREILNRIVATNGNALWVARIIPSKNMENEPFYAQGYLNGGQAADFHWQIVSLKEEQTRRSGS